MDDKKRDKKEKERKKKDSKVQSCEPALHNEAPNGLKGNPKAVAAAAAFTAPFTANTIDLCPQSHPLPLPPPPSIPTSTSSTTIAAASTTANNTISIIQSCAMRQPPLRRRVNRLPHQPRFKCLQWVDGVRDLVGEALEANPQIHGFSTKPILFIVLLGGSFFYVLQKVLAYIYTYIRHTDESWGQLTSECLGAAFAVYAILKLLSHWDENNMRRKRQRRLARAVQRAQAEQKTLRKLAD